MERPRISGHVLVVDDEAMVREVVGRYLQAAGFDVAEAADGRAALTAIERSRPDLVVLDVMLPEIDGLSVLQKVRSTSDVPVVLLTARGDELDRIAGLEIGADDYVTKPFSPRELVARVRTVLRRAAPTVSGNGRSAVEQKLVFDGLEVDPTTREVLVDGVTVDLTRLEFDLLHFLASSPKQVFTRAQLLAEVWDSSEDWQDPSTVTTHIRRVRRKVERDPDEPRWLTTAWGVGYRFEP